MNTIRAVEAYYPAFHLGCDPAAVRCTLAIVEANGRRYLQTPFAFLDAHADDDIERSIGPGKGYYATEAECLDYLRHEYPWHVQARPLMEALVSNLRLANVGGGAVADKIGVSFDNVYKIARGHKSYGLKAVRAAVKALSA